MMGGPRRRNLQLLCGYCNRTKGTKGKDGYRLKMAELRSDNVATGVIVDEALAVITGKRLGAIPSRRVSGITGGCGGGRE